MKRKQLGTALIERVDYPNKGRFYLEESGEKGIIKNVLPGQEVLFRVYKKHGDQLYGNPVQVLKASPMETREPFCAHFGSCGGCLYQTLPYETQLAMKAEQIGRLFKPVLEEETVFDGIKGSPRELEYRNKVDLSFGNEVIGGPLKLGMHKKATRYTVLDADSCALMHTDLRRILGEIRAYCAERELPFYNKLRHEGFLRYLMLRRSETTGEILAVLAVSTQLQHDFSPMVERLCALPLEGSIAGIFLAHDDRYADALIADEVFCLYGRDYFYEKLLGLSFKVTLFSFFQTNTLGAEVLYSTVRSYVRMRGETRPPVLYDLYCGTGTIAQILAGEAEKVYGIELVEEAVEAAKRNAALNGLENCVFYAGDVGETLSKLPERPDYVILDPPREGVHEKALGMITGYGISSMVYISCKATSFVTDMKYLRNAGWRLERYTLVDLFPETPHVEAVCLLTHSSSSI